MTALVAFLLIVLAPIALLLAVDWVTSRRRHRRDDAEWAALPSLNDMDAEVTP